MSLFTNVWLTEKLDFLIKKNNLKTGIISEEQVKIKLFQLFKSIAKYLDLSLTYPWTLRKLFHLLLPLYLYQWQLLMESWDSQGKKKTSFRNYIIRKSEALHTIPPEYAAWFFDNMALIICLKPKHL